MPFIESTGGRIHYRLDPATDASADAPVLVLSNSLGANLSMWDPQVASLVPRFRVLRYDTRGLGRSPVVGVPSTLERLAGDVIALLDGLGIERAHFCGLSMGGLIGMSIGARYAERVHRLILCSTAAHIGTTESWNSRIAKVLESGMESVADAVIDRWFTRGFMAREPAVVERMRDMLVQSPPGGYAACCVALRDADETANLGRIQARTLVISGAHDPVTPPSDGRFLAGSIPGAQYVELEASHLSNIEAAPDFNWEVLRFLARSEAP